jgi:hypothetical protein
MYRLSFFVPVAHVEQVKLAVFEAGAGRQGDYEQCCWQTLGAGQFMPREGSNPFLGEIGAVLKVEELKVEMICDDECIVAVVDALKRAHPYEEPAYQVDKLAQF